MSGVEGSVIVVTGAGGGLGRAHALLLASLGAKVVVNDLGGAVDGTGAGVSMADDVVAEIRAAGGEAVANHDTVMTVPGATAMVATAIDTFGHIDGVVNNAGILRDATFVSMTAEDWDAVMAVHLDGAFNVTRAAWPHFREQGHGRVVMTTSTSGIYGNFGQSNYGAAKLGLVGLMNTLVREGRKYDILINAVAPLASTRMTEGMAPPEVMQTLGPELVSPVVAYLLTEECTDSGTVLIAGGGMVQRVQQFSNQGVTFTGPPSLDEVATRWAEVIDMSDAVPGVSPLG